MKSKFKVVTIVGTRPEIIRLSSTIKLLDKHLTHILVHTGQNYDYELNELFFADLDLNLISDQKWLFDVAGHYARPDVFEFKIKSA